MLLKQKLFKSMLFVFVNLGISHSTAEVTVTPINEIEKSVDMITHSVLPFDNIDSTPSPIITGFGVTEMAHTKIHNATNETFQIFSTPNACIEKEEYLHFVPDASNCSNYYQVCTKQSSLSLEQIRLVLLNSSHVKSCAKRKLFDSISGHCAHKNVAFCGVYKCPEPDGFFLDPNNRYSFIHCFDSVPKRKSCEPKGTVFSKESKVCMWAPEEIPFGLKIFQTFLWLVKLTESSESSNGFIDSTEDYIKAGTVAILIPAVYILVIIVLYKQFNNSGKNRRDTSYLADADDFHHRYYRRPIRSGIATLNPAPSHSTRNILSDSYFVTSSF